MFRKSVVSTSFVRIAESIHLSVCIDGVRVVCERNGDGNERHILEKVKIENCQNTQNVNKPHSKVTI